jgi:WbqC-like protein family
MILAASRPYFAPYPGYFLKALLADVFVILDSVQFPRGTTWITRNRFKSSQGTLWMTIPVRKKGLGLQPIDTVRICRGKRWVRKHIESLKHAYGHAPYFDEHAQSLWANLLGESDRLIDLNLEIIRCLMQEVAIQPRVVRLSDLEIQAAGTQLLIEICKALDASIYLAQRSARSHIDAGLFQAAGIELRLVTPPTPIYPQLWGDFIPDLSTFDLLFNCGPKAREIAFARESSRSR